MVEFKVDLLFTLWSSPRSKRPDLWQNRRGINAFGNVLGNGFAGTSSQSRDPWTEFENLGNELGAGDRYAANAPATNPADFAGADAQAMSTDGAKQGGKPMPQVVVIGHKMSFLEKLESYVVEAGDAIKNLFKSNNDSMRSTDEIPQNWTAAMPSPSYAHGVAEKILSEGRESGPMLVPVDPTAESQTANRLTTILLLGFPGAALPGSIATVTGQSESQIEAANEFGGAIAGGELLVASMPAVNVKVVVA